MSGLLLYNCPQVALVAAGASLGPQEAAGLGGRLCCYRLRENDFVPGGFPLEVLGKEITAAWVGCV